MLVKKPSLKCITQAIMIPLIMRFIKFCNVIGAIFTCCQRLRCCQRCDFFNTCNSLYRLAFQVGYPTAQVVAERNIIGFCQHVVNNCNLSACTAHVFNFRAQLCMRWLFSGYSLSSVAGYFIVNALTMNNEGAQQQQQQKINLRQACVHGVRWCTGNG